MVSSNLVVVVIVIAAVVADVASAGEVCVDVAKDNEAALRAAFLKLNPSLATSTKSKYFEQKI